jgi:hypothetical protein
MAPRADLLPEADETLISAVDVATRAFLVRLTKTLDKPGAPPGL